MESAVILDTLPDWAASSWGPFNVSPYPSVVNPVLTASQVTDVSAKYVADPFLFFENGKWYMFFEVVKQSNSRGEIGLATSLDGLAWTYDRIVLREDFHLSYPLVFKYGNDYYMMPETASVQEARLYIASNFPYGWTHVATLLNGDIHDASIFRYNDVWWMFFGDTGYYGRSDNCYLYYSDNLFTGWQAHPMSPIVVNDKSKARPAGRPFVYDGNIIIRLAQKNDVSYGEAVRAFQVDTLTKTSYSEHEVTQSPLLTKSGSGWNASGMHTLDPWWTGSDWISAVDGKDNNQLWSIGIYRATGLAPVIASTPVTSAVVGQPYSYDVNATGTPAPTYTLTTSPLGMTIDGSTGLIQWTPQSPGSFAVTVKTTNSAGTDVQNFTIDVTAPASMPVLTSVTLSPGSVQGGVSSTGTATLDNPAPADGVVIVLTSSNMSVAQVPPNVMVPAGTMTASFTVTTSAVTRNTSVTISASYDGVTREATLNIKRRRY